MTDKYYSPWNFLLKREIGNAFSHQLRGETEPAVYLLPQQQGNSYYLPFLLSSSPVFACVCICICLYQGEKLNQFFVVQSVFCLYLYLNVSWEKLNQLLNFTAQQRWGNSNCECLHNHRDCTPPCSCQTTIRNFDTNCCDNGAIILIMTSLQIIMVRLF